MAMVQYGITDQCNGSCDFCLIKGNPVFGQKQINREIDRTIENIKYLDSLGKWNTDYKDGISVIGGELYYITDQEYKEKFMQMIDVICDVVINKSNNKDKVRFSTVTNGNYDPNNLLFPVIDRIAEKCSIKNVDVNFSYDLDWRFKTEEQRKRVENTINSFHNRYNYKAGIQMILTQKLIDRILNEGWRPKTFIDKVLPGNQLALLYPHPINRGNNFTGDKNLEGFNFKRDDFIKTMLILKEESPVEFEAFYMSTRNSAVFKTTGLYDKGDSVTDEQAETQMPRYADGKEIINYNCPVKHSILYKCYIDSDKCMLCDLEELI